MRKIIEAVELPTIYSGDKVSSSVKKVVDQLVNAMVHYDDNKDGMQSSDSNFTFTVECKPVSYNGKIRKEVSVDYQGNESIEGDRYNLDPGMTVIIIVASITNRSINVSYSNGFLDDKLTVTLLRDILKYIS